MDISGSASAEEELIVLHGTSIGSFLAKTSKEKDHVLDPPRLQGKAGNKNI